MQLKGQRSRLQGQDILHITYLICIRVARKATRISNTENIIIFKRQTEITATEW